MGEFAWFDGKGQINDEKSLIDGMELSGKLLMCPFINL